MNEDWNIEQDGGALRIYHDSQHLTLPEEAVSCEYIDLAPIGLLIFDSRLVHAVKPVTTGDKKRRALTLWINRPNNSGVRGETYY